MKKIAILGLLATITFTSTSYANVYNLKTPSDVKCFFDQKKPTVIMEGTKWCPACVKAKPDFEKASEAFCGEVLFGYMDADKIRLRKAKDVNYVPNFVAGKTETEVRSAISLGKLKDRDYEGLVRYVEKYTGVKRCK